MTFRALAVPLLLLAAVSSHAMAADTLLVDRVQENATQLAPQRGWTRAQVVARLGEPQEKLEQRGGQKRQWPLIQRWVYPGFTVYFERDRVIDTVVTHASPDEIGPKPIPQ